MHNQADWGIGQERVDGDQCSATEATVFSLSIEAVSYTADQVTVLRSVLVLRHIYLLRFYYIIYVVESKKKRGIQFLRPDAHFWIIFFSDWGIIRIYSFIDFPSHISWLV